jgi:hypothetical protein
MHQRFRRKPDHAVTAVQLRMDTNGLHYRKWGHEQHAKAGDWIVDNGSEVYSVDADSFASTYRPVGPGRYVKTAPVWAQRATQAGRVNTKEGVTTFNAGDWVVSNREDGSDVYAISAAAFDDLYEPDE